MEQEWNIWDTFLNESRVKIHEYNDGLTDVCGDADVSSFSGTGSVITVPTSKSIRDNACLNVTIDRLG